MTLISKKKRKKNIIAYEKENEERATYMEFSYLPPTIFSYWLRHYMAMFSDRAP
jgi:hypothetical protein